MEIAAFNFVASTGRTATTYIAAVLASMPEVAACHEGYLGATKNREPLLPLINLENRQAYKSPETALGVVRDKRSVEVILEACRKSACHVIVDVAYYNSTIAGALLTTHRSARMVGLIRDCESFVRSATVVRGEDTLPVGWPHPSKPLSAREKFIQLGRLRPLPKSEESGLWSEWSAVMRNIWLWRETNLLLCDAKAAHPDRVRLLRYEGLVRDPPSFWSAFSSALELSTGQDGAEDLMREFQNARPGGYQIPGCKDWSTEERDYLQQSSGLVESRLTDLGAESR